MLAELGDMSQPVGFADDGFSLKITEMAQCIADIVEKSGGSDKPEAFDFHQ